MDLPKVTQEPKKFVDMTPDVNLAIRILQAYLDDCNCKWEVSGLDDESRIIFDQMNKHQEQRRKILEEAIQRLGPCATLTFKETYDYPISDNQPDKCPSCGGPLMLISEYSTGGIVPRYRCMDRKTTGCI